MFSFLTKPYPAPDLRLARLLFFSVFIGGFVALFLIFFKPFGTAQANIPNLNLFLAGYGGVIALVTFLPSLLLSVSVPQLFREQSWTIGRQMLYLFFIVSLGISASYWYLLRSGGQANWSDYFYFFRNGLLVASFPIVVLTLLDYIRKLRRYETGAAQLNARRATGKMPALATAPASADLAPATAPTPPPPPARPLVLTDGQQRPVLTTSAAQVWCLHSDGNYVEVWTVSDTGKHERTIIRNTLSGLAKQLPNEMFLTCHRSWIVNPELVETVTGNAQGYQLHRTDGPTVIVARGRSQAVLSALNTTPG